MRKRGRKTADAILRSRLSKAPSICRRHKKAGTVSMAPPNGSQFLITARDECDALDDKATVFGHVVDGMDVVMK